ncbi:MAG: hypothetical protein HFP81_04525 [Methylococcales symbiont of Hymedesmia sp. n. MRB-2018]|nr:MAG: hypothetical protein HFP78_01665 [Methylococcales symbiont of Hymedesmia sp. n. MRB-2018]KAF3983976.1 MAG: hypothetical protein HFP81_04525 [Methylococcales symbiont of Hymedesmia sp. n. MRB-2018]
MPRLDRIESEQHELAGRAKDLGSAAVMLLIFMVLATWANYFNLKRKEQE